MLKDDQLKSCAISGCMWYAEEEENGTMLLWWSTLGMPLCLPREKNLILSFSCTVREGDILLK